MQDIANILHLITPDLPIKRVTCTILSGAQTVNATYIIIYDGNGYYYCIFCGITRGIISTVEAVDKIIEQIKIQEKIQAKILFYELKRRLYDEFIKNGQFAFDLIRRLNGGEIIRTPKKCPEQIFDLFGHYATIG